MNCKQCGSHILATMQVMWGSNPFHADCIGDAIKENKSEIPQTDSTLPDAYFEQLDESFDEPFEDEYDEFDELVARMDEREVSDEVLAQIPAPNNGQGNGNVIIPDVVEPFRREVHINDVIASATQSFIADRQGVSSNGVGTLIAGRDTRFVPREFLAAIPKPESTDTFKPIPHSVLIDQIIDSLWYRRMNVVRDEYAVSTDGMKMFGLIELDIEYKGVRFAIGIRNANDRSMRVAMVAGYKVTVCSNMMLQGDFNPMLSKHSKNFELQDTLSIACDRVQRNFGNLHQEITAKQEKRITAGYARELCYKAFTDGKFPISLMRTVHREYFEKPSYQEFEEPTIWSLENAFTSAFKKLEPVAQFQATAKLGKFLAAY